MLNCPSNGTNPFLAPGLTAAMQAYLDVRDAMLFEHLRGDHDGFVPQEVGTLGSILGEQTFGQLLKPLSVFAWSNSIPNLQQCNMCGASQ